MSALREPAHGLPGYRKGCHCEVCRAANTAKHAEWKRSGRPIPEHVHGTEGGYGNWGCRCDACCAANAAKMERRRRARGVPPARFWTPVDDVLLLAAVDLEAIAQRLHRTVSACRWRRWLLRRRRS